MAEAVQDNRLDLLRQELTESARFLRRQNRDGSFDPVAAWLEDDGRMIGQVGHKPPQEVDEDWIEGVLSWSKPVTEAAYFAVMDGGPWPDLPPPIDLPFSNKPREPFDVALDEIKAEEQALAAWLAANTIHDTETKGLAGNWINRIKALWQRLEAMRVEEKRPHDEAAKEVQAKFKPHLAKAAELEERLWEPLRVYLLEEKARAEAARKAALAAGENTTPRYQDRAGKAGTSGRTVSVRKTVTAVIEDADKALLAMKSAPEIQEALQKVCNRVIRAGGVIPGVRREEQ